MYAPNPDDALINNQIRNQMPMIQKSHEIKAEFAATIMRSLLNIFTLYYCFNTLISTQSLDFLWLVATCGFANSALKDAEDYIRQTQYLSTFNAGFETNFEQPITRKKPNYINELVDSASYNLSIFTRLSTYVIALLCIAGYFYIPLPSLYSCLPVMISISVNQIITSFLVVSVAYSAYQEDDSRFIDDISSKYLAITLFILATLFAAYTATQLASGLTLVSLVAAIKGYAPVFPFAIMGICAIDKTIDSILLSADVLLSIAAQITAATIHNALYTPRRSAAMVYRKATKLPEVMSGVYSKLSDFMPTIPAL